MLVKIRHIPWYLNWKGLLGEKAEPILLQTRFGIHTFGMKYPIDVLVLDKKYIVIKIKFNLQPNQLFFWNPRYNNVVELPQGTIKGKISVGEKIEVLPSPEPRSAGKSKGSFL